MKQQVTNGRYGSSAQERFVTPVSFLPYCALLLCVAHNLTGCSPGVSGSQFSKLEQSISDIRSIQTDHTNDLATLQNELRTLAGRVEELEFSQNQRIGKEVSSLKNDLSNLKQRVPPPPIVPVQALEADESQSRGMSTESGRMLSDGLLFVREGKYREAMSLFSNVIEISGSDPAAPYALFWLGVSADGLGDNRGALRAYNDLISLHGKHTRVPLALLRQASVFIRLGDSTAASLTLKKLQSDFPKSAEASIAKEKLKDLAPAKR